MYTGKYNYYYPNIQVQDRQVQVRRSYNLIQHNFILQMKMADSKSVDEVFGWNRILGENVFFSRSLWKRFFFSVQMGLLMKTVSIKKCFFCKNGFFCCKNRFLVTMGFWWKQFFFCGENIFLWYQVVLLNLTKLQKFFL